MLHQGPLGNDGNHFTGLNHFGIEIHINGRCQIDIDPDLLNQGLLISHHRNPQTVHPRWHIDDRIISALIGRSAKCSALNQHIGPNQRRIVFRINDQTADFSCHCAPPRTGKYQHENRSQKTTGKTLSLHGSSFIQVVF